jgi:hypothetical protein
MGIVGPRLWGGGGAGGRGQGGDWREWGRGREKQNDRERGREMEWGRGRERRTERVAVRWEVVGDDDGKKDR